VTAPPGLRDLPAGEAAFEGLRAVACRTCRRMFLAPQGAQGCPCGGAFEPADARVPEHPPERIVPAKLSRADLPACLRAHLGRGWMRDRRLDADRLAASAVLVWWPRWLVDATVRSPWSAEVGFEYDANSTVEVLEGGAWRSVPRVERRVRWEPRGGTLDRRYDDVAIEALRRAKTVAALAGQAQPGDPRRPGALVDGLVLLPDLSPDEVWSAVEPGFRAYAGEDVRAATGAEHVRDVHLAPEYADLCWTVRLHPVWWCGASVSGARWPLLVDGVTGRVWGPVPKSMGAAWGWAAAIASAGAALLALTLLLAVVGLVLLFTWVLVPFTGILGAVLLVAAIAPPLVAWRHNEAEKATLRQLP
jgi:hypothetical protein